MTMQIIENPSVLNLSKAFERAHEKYLRAEIDLTFRNKVLTPLQTAFHEFEKQADNIYSADIADGSKNLLLRLRSLNLLVEGLYWIGAYKEASRELQRYSGIESILQESSDKELSRVFFDVSELTEMKEAGLLLKELSRSDAFEEEKRRILRELIRVCLNIAVICHYGSHRYGKASDLLKICRGFAEGISSEHSPGYGLLGQIDYFTACSWRQINRLNDCEKKLTQVLDHYLNRINLKFNEYLAAGASEQSWFDFNRSAGLSRYRTALTLMVRSDLNRRRGKLSIALYQNLAVARIILAETLDIVNRAYAKMLFAIISREMHADEKNLLEALSETEQAQREFSEMRHRKYERRSLFERAYTLFYLARFYKNRGEVNRGKAEESIKEGLAILQKLKNDADDRWLAQYLTLEGRLLIIQADLKGPSDLDRALKAIDQAISKLEHKHNHKTYLVEAYIAKSRVLMESYVHSTRKSCDEKLLNQAEDLLIRAQRANLNETDGVPENNKVEAIINFVLARIKIRQGDRSGAEEQLEAGVKHLPVIESDGVKRLYECAKNEINKANFTFVVINGLDINTNKNALEKFILQQAIERASKEGRKPWEVINMPRSTFHNLINKHGLMWKKKDGLTGAARPDPIEC